MNSKGDEGSRGQHPPTLETQEKGGSFLWTNRNAKDWSKMKFRHLFKDQQFDTNAGLCTITEVERCEGDAYATRKQGYLAVYDWEIKLRWKGQPRDDQDLVIPGTIEISNFSSSRCINDLIIIIQTDVRRPEADKLMAAFRSVVLPRLRGHLENYVYFLLDVLKAPSRPGLPPTSKPAQKPHVWLKSNQPEVAEGDSETPNSQAPAHIDIFQEREGAGGMRVGRDFQAKIPPLLCSDDQQTTLESNDKALLVWSPPTNQLSEDEIEKYLETSRDKYQYSGEQALGLLFWHRYDIDKSLHDLGNFTPHPEEWTVEDKVLFEQAFQFHGKAFDRIRQMLPDKSMSNLIRYYYKWKKFKNKTSVMDRQAKKFSQEDGDEPPLLIGTGNHNNNNKHSSVVGYKNSHHGNVSDLESDEKRAESSGQLCSNCGIPCGISCTDLNLTENMCNTCYVYWKRTGAFRPLTGPLRRGERQVLGALRQLKISPPKGMLNLNHDDLNTLASSTPQAENVTLQGLEKAVLDEKCRVQIKKQEIEILKRSLPKDGMDKYRQKVKTPNDSKISSKWSQEELMLAAEGIRRHGRNFQKIAQVIGTKTEAHMKWFYTTNKKRFNLDQLIKEYDLEKPD